VGDFVRDSGFLVDRCMLAGIILPPLERYGASVRTDFRGALDSRPAWLPTGRVGHHPLCYRGCMRSPFLRYAEGRLGSSPWPHWRICRRVHLRGCFGGEKPPPSTDRGSTNTFSILGMAGREARVGQAAEYRAAGDAVGEHYDLSGGYTFPLTLCRVVKGMGCGSCTFSPRRCSQSSCCHALVASWLDGEGTQVQRETLVIPAGHLVGISPLFAMVGSLGRWE